MLQEKGGESMGKRRIWIYLLLFVYMIINYGDRSNMSVASSSVAKSLHLSPGLLGILMSSFLWMYIVAVVPMGATVDKLGTKIVTAVSVAVWSIAQIFTGLSSNFVSILLSRLGLGLGESASFPVAASIVNEWAPSKERGRAMSIYQAGTLIGPGLGAIFVAWLITAFNWRVPFYITGAIGLVFFFVWLAVFRKPETAKWLGSEERERILAERASNTHEKRESNSTMTIGDFARSSSMWGTAVTQGCAVYALYLFLTWLPNYLVNERHMTIMHSGVVTALPYFFAAFLEILVAVLSDKILTEDGRGSGRRRTVVVFTMLASAVVMFTPIVQSTVLVVILITISITGLNASLTMNYALLNDLLALPSNSGKANGLLTFGGNIVGFLSPIVTGYVLQFTGHYAMAFVIAGIMLVLGSASALTLTHKRIGSTLNPVVSNSVSG